MRKYFLCTILSAFALLLCMTAGCSSGIPHENITTGTDNSPDTSALPGSDDNLLSSGEADFENLTSISETKWSVFGNGSAQLSDKAHSGTACYAVCGRENEWTTPTLDLFPYIKENGAGLYTISFWLAFDGSSETNAINFGTLIRSDSTADINSFISDNASNYYCRLDNVSAAAAPGEWFYIERSFYIEENDLNGVHSWKLCLDMLTADVKTIYLDDCKLKKESYDMNIQPQIPSETQIWTANELVLISEKNYSDPFGDVTLDAVFTHSGGRKFTVPAFWDGESVWRVRFMLPEEGIWSFTTISNDTTDTGLNGINGNIKCTAYTGELEIYKHGFLKTEENVRYFMYNDGSPFFYLGDTHWNMPSEEFDTAGEHAGVINTDSHFKYIVDTRVKQGFTVYQSEPIGASYNLADGLTQADIFGFRRLDEKFGYIARAGLVHANAALFFTSELANNSGSYSDEYLEKLARYWVARYCAYPVLWTLAQECDDDFYFDRGDQKTFDAVTNPWKKICAYIYKYDPYASPMSAHQEYASMDAIHGVNASRSSFRDLAGHSWYAAQWSPSLASLLDFSIVRDFFNNGQGKPIVNYEGRYDYLWTKHFGARVQGWTAFLNGMCGYGYGAIDIWLYKSTFNSDVTSDDGVNKITPEDKSVLWSESIHFETANQMSYMRSFFENIAWYRLTPRFNDSAWIIPQTDTLYSLATEGSDMYVCYFYNRSGSTAELCGLQNAEYTLRRYNPRDNTYTKAEIIVPDNGRFNLGDKPDKEDWVFILEIKR